MTDPYLTRFHYGKPPSLAEGLALALLGAAMFAWRVAEPRIKRLGRIR